MAVGDWRGSSPCHHFQPARSQGSACGSRSAGSGSEHALGAGAQPRRRSTRQAPLSVVLPKLRNQHVPHTGGTCQYGVRDSSFYVGGSQAPDLLSVTTTIAGVPTQFNLTYTHQGPTVWVATQPVTMYADGNTQPLCLVNSNFNSQILSCTLVGYLVSLP